VSAVGLSPKCWKPPPENIKKQDELSTWKQKFESVLTVTPCYGYRKMTAAFRRSGEVVNHKKVMRLMRVTGLKQKKRKFKPRTTDSRHKLRIFPNLVKEIVPSYPHHMWVGDITYVRLPNGFSYVAILLDVYTKKVVGWSIALHMEKELVLEALDMALKVGTPMYHHSDRGGQYCATDYVKRLEDAKVQVSMADTGVSVDNPFAESFNKTLKVEEVYLHDYQNIDEARVSIGAFINDVYHAKRLHQSLGYRTPNEVLTEWLLQNKTPLVPLVH
jgi:putative transposase